MGLSAVSGNEMAAILSNEDHTSTVRGAYFERTMTVFLAKYVRNIRILLHHGRLKLCIPVRSK